MDPLSIIASIAGIATAGTALAKAIYELVSTARGTSREILAIARSISDLSIILRELREVLKGCTDLCSRRLLRRIQSATRRISKLHFMIHDLIAATRGSKLKWTLKRSEILNRQNQIESHKAGISIMLNILVLAVASKKHSLEPSKGEDLESQKEIQLLRQQSENLALAAYQNLTDWNQTDQPDKETEAKDPDEMAGEQREITGTELQMVNKASEGTAEWLYDLVFASHVQSWDSSDSAQPNNSSADSVSDGSEDDVLRFDPEGHRDNDINRFLTQANHSSMQLAIHQPGATNALVQELLADWTVLSEKEIKVITSGTPTPEKSRSSSTDMDKDGDSLPMITLKDCVGRLFRLPFYRVKTWKGMKALIESAFTKVETLGPHVQEGHFDLIAPDGYIILPEVWEDIIQPDMQIAMEMWPIEKKAQPQQEIPPNSHVPIEPTGASSSPGFRTPPSVVRGPPPGVPVPISGIQGPPTGGRSPILTVDPLPGKPSMPAGPGRTKKVAMEKTKTKLS